MGESKMANNNNRVRIKEDSYCPICLNSEKVANIGIRGKIFLSCLTCGFIHGEMLK